MRHPSGSRQRQLRSGGARRRLHTLLEKLLVDLSFDAPELEEKQVTIDAAYVEAKLAEIAVNRDLSQFVL